jgi:type IX secretion system PorP/SprF family membrane protein
MTGFATQKCVAGQASQRGKKEQKQPSLVTSAAGAASKSGKPATQQSMKNVIAFALLVLAISTTVFAQQDPMYSQHMYNKLPLNPAYAGSRDVISAVALYRRQWVTFPGAPKTGTVSVHSPLANRKLALGLNATMDQHGITSNTAVSGQFAYRIPTRDGVLSLGVQGSVSNFRMGLTTATSAVDFDPSLLQDVNTFLGNAGAGIFYSTDRYYVGASIPNLIENTLSGVSVGEMTAQQSRHYYAMGGYVLDVNRTLKVRPTVLVKYVANAPVQADLGVALLLDNKIWVGGQFRTLGAMDLMVEYQATESLRIGYSYGQQLGALGMNTLGSHEVLVGFDLPTKSSRRPKPGSIRCFF